MIILYQIKITPYCSINSHWCNRYCIFQCLWSNPIPFVNPYVHRRTQKPISTNPVSNRLQIGYAFYDRNSIWSMSILKVHTISQRIFSICVFTEPATTKSISYTIICSCSVLSVFRVLLAMQCPTQNARMVVICWDVQRLHCFTWAPIEHCFRWFMVWVDANKVHGIGYACWIAFILMLWRWFYSRKHYLWIEICSLNIN